MKNKDLLHAMGDIDDRFIEEAAPEAVHKPRWYRYVAAAAAACLVLLASVFALHDFTTPDPEQGRYKYTVTQKTEAALVLRWEDRALHEQYTEMIFRFNDYRIRNSSIRPELLGEYLGDCEATGYDVYTDQTFRETFPVYAIAAVESEDLVAVKMGDTFYVFICKVYHPPQTLGEMLTRFHLRETLPLAYFGDYTQGRDRYCLLQNADAVWALLEACGDAPYVKGNDRMQGSGGDYISFTATSEILGIYKQVIYITGDGYLKTNIMDYGYYYDIGEEAAARIIACARENATETEFQPYTLSVAGVITEIGEDYMVVNDSVLCWNEADGISFRVLTDNPEFARWLKYYDFQVGDVVYIQYRHTVDQENGNTIAGAFSICEAILQEDHIILIPE